jgi:mRNA interferase MazF
MISYRPGDLVFISFPFTAGSQTKGRPAMVVLDAGDADVLVARVTTQSGQSEFDVLLGDWRGAGLLAPSTVRLHRLATLEKSLIQRSLGSVQADDRPALRAAIRRIIGSW